LDQKFGDLASLILNVGKTIYKGLSLIGQKRDETVVKIQVKNGVIK
tara:strand:- start:1268 stop:1405 length:138 start_codon:yes stop_codon:yes gene_type:complete